MSVYRTNYTRNSPFLGQIVPETIFTLIFNDFSFFHTFSGNRKLPLKPLRKLFAPIIGALLNAFLYIYKSPVIVLLEGRQLNEGKILCIIHLNLKYIVWDSIE